MQRLGTRLEMTVKPKLVMDIIDEQSASQDAQAIAENLIEEHKGDLKKIRKAAFAIKNPYPGYDLVAEIMWAAQWLTSSIEAKK